MPPFQNLTKNGKIRSLGEGDELKFFTLYKISFWVFKEEGQNHVRKVKTIEIDNGNPPALVHGVWKFSDPPVGPLMENAKNQKLEFFSDYGHRLTFFQILF